ncbi:hypothetical protein MTR_2g031450 [Medicago truncatula]|uniref:Uncharacterized protein n=1 Tax=Medicago truncatula TaxID=3880 RepID=G7IMM2_MEDTR|nr:hypothetical protein MTR_2g031450 [Medicago truncatula]
MTNDAEGSSSQAVYEHLQYQQPHQHEGEGHQQEVEAQWEPAMEFEAGPHGFPGAL